MSFPVPLRPPGRSARAWRVVALILLGGLIPVDARRGPGEDLPPLPDPALVEELDRSGRLAWYEALETIEDGESDVQTGKWYQARQASALNPNEDLARLHAIGRETEARGRAKIRQGRERLAALAERARKLRDTRRAEEEQAGAHRLELSEPASFEAGLSAAAEDLLGRLHDAGRNRIFVHGIYAYTPQRASLQADWTDALAAAFKQADGTRFSVASAPDLALVPADDDETVHITFSGLDQVRPEDSASLVLGELFPEPDGATGLLVLRAIDRETWTLVAVHVTRLKLPKPANSGEPEPAADPAGPLRLLATPILGVGLTDATGFVQRAREGAALYRYRFDYDDALFAGYGIPHAPPSLIKALLVEEAEAPVTDFDFLVRVLRGELPDADPMLRRDINAAWTLRPAESGEGWILGARQLASRTSLTVGPVTLSPLPPETEAEAETPADR